MGQFLGHQLGMLLAALAGLGVVVFLGRLVNAIVAKIRKAVPTAAPADVSAEEWDQITTTDPGPGQWLGVLERILFFVTISFGAWEVVAGWLIFKVGSKWEVWNNIVKVPPSFSASGNVLSHLRARHAWGTRVLQSFLVGTLASVLAGLVAAVAAKFVIGAWEVAVG